MPHIYFAGSFDCGGSLYHMSYLRDPQQLADQLLQGYSSSMSPASALREAYHSILEFYQEWMPEHVQIHKRACYSSR